MEETSTSNFTLNDTVYESVGGYLCGPFPHEYFAFDGVCLVISLCGLVGNGMVIWFLGFQMKQNSFTVYILNLAVADFSLLLLFLLVTLNDLSVLAFCWFLFGLVNYGYFMYAFTFLSHVFYLSGLGLLTALSVDRCVSVLCPIWYRCHRPQHLSGIVCGAVWVLDGLLLSSLYVTFAFTEDAVTIVALVALAISMLFSLMMLVSNLFLVLKLCCDSWRRHLGKPFVAILLNVLVFFACGMPFCVEIFFNPHHTAFIFPLNTYFLLAVLNSSLNPVIYVLVGSWRRRHFQCSFRVALQRVFAEKAGSVEGSHGAGDAAVEVTAV